MQQHLAARRTPQQARPHREGGAPCRSSPRRGGRIAAVAVRAASANSSSELDDPPAYSLARHRQRGQLSFFLDSADIGQWERWQNGTLRGVTTNPLILQRDNVPCTIKAIRALVGTAKRLQFEELQVQTWGRDAATMEANALRLLELDDANLLTIKLPCTHEGLTAASALINSDADTYITMTGVYTPHQILAAQAIGADYAAPYLGRMADNYVKLSTPLPPGTPTVTKKEAMAKAVQDVVDMQAMVRRSGGGMRVLVASIRRATQLAELAVQGCDTFTLSPAVMDALCVVSHTLAAAADFEEAVAANGDGR